MDFVDKSGREHLTVAERVQWLASEAVELEAERARFGLRQAAGDRLVGFDIHELGEMLMSMKIAARDFAKIDFASASRHLTRLECRLKAYHRGGVAEVARWRAELTSLVRYRNDRRVARVQWRNPQWPVLWTKGLRPRDRVDAFNPWLDLGGEGGL